MKSLAQQNQNQQQASQPAPLTSESATDASLNRDLQHDVLTLEKELAASHETIDALTSELTSKETQLSAILNSRAWRWVSRYGRIKRAYLAPTYEFFQRLFGNGKPPHTHQTDRYSTDALAASGVQSVAALNKSPILLPSPRLEGLSAIALEPLCPTPLPRADVICFSIVDWNFRYQRPQQIISQFAANGHRVFYIRLDRTLPAHERPRFALVKLKENVYEVTLSAHRQPWINQEDIKGANHRALLNSLDELRHACQINEAISYVMSPSWTSAALETKRRWGWHLIYDCMDEWDGFPGMGREITKAEQRLVRGCDLLVVTAQRLYDKWVDLDRPIVLARNAVDYEFYMERYQANNLLAGVEHPIVGYYGAIADWFDLELMTHVVRERPEYTFVFLGGVFDVDVSELASLSNVRLLFQQPYETMPQYLYHFDACLIPFKTNKTTEATDPVKAYEYLSGGKPVVSVALPELEPLRDLLYIANDRDEFLVGLDKALTEHDPKMVERRRSFAARNTWAKRYHTIAEGLRDATARASIIVVTYNNLAITRLCLESIVRNTDYPNYEVIVVDNNSSDETPAYLRQMAAQYPHFQIILNSENRGFAGANNQGLACSTGERFVLLNNDTVVPRGWLGRLLRHLENPALGLVGPVTNFTGNEARVQVDYRTVAEMEAFADELMRANEGQVADIHMLAMFCVAFRRDTYEKVGPLDEQFGIGMFEDDDYSLRIKKCNLRVVCAADVFVHHVGQAAFKKLITNGTYDALFSENRRRFESKWNVTWVPHKNAPLHFEPSPASSRP